MKLMISLSADHSFIKGDRVVCKIAKNEWYIGTVIRAGVKLKIDFDDDFDAVIEPADFKHVKLLAKPKKLKRALTDIEAKMLYEVKKTLKEAVKKVEVKKPLVPEKKPIKTVIAPKKPFVPVDPPKIVKPIVKSPVTPKPIETPEPVAAPKPAIKVATPPAKPIERQYKNNWTVQINALTARHWKYIVLDDPAAHTFKFASSSMATSTQEALKRALMDVKGATFTIELKTFAEPGQTAQIHVLKNLTPHDAEAKLAELMKSLQPAPVKKPEPIKVPVIHPVDAVAKDWNITLVPDAEKMWSYAIKDAENNPKFVKHTDYIFNNVLPALNAALMHLPTGERFKLKIAEEIKGNAIVRSTVKDNVSYDGAIDFVTTYQKRLAQDEAKAKRAVYLIPNETNAWKFVVTEHASDFFEQSSFEFKNMKDAFEAALLYIADQNIDLAVAEEMHGLTIVRKSEFADISLIKARIVIDNLMQGKFVGRTALEILTDPNRKGKVISKALYETVGDADAYAKACAGSDLQKLDYLHAVYRRANQAIFDNRMRMPRVRFFKEQKANSFRKRGHWSPRDREIALGRRLFNASEIHVLNTFVHEMCHQAVTDIDRTIDPNGGHGPNWIRWMKIAGIPPDRYDTTDQMEYMNEEERLKTEQIRRERERQMNENYRTKARPSALALGTPVQFYQPSDFKWIQGVAVGIFASKFVMADSLTGHHWSLPNGGRDMVYLINTGDSQQDFTRPEWQNAAQHMFDAKTRELSNKRMKRKMKKYDPYGY